MSAISDLVWWLLLGMSCARCLCWLALLFLRNTELRQVINFTGYCSNCSHQKLIKVHSYLLPSWKPPVAAVITFCECVMTSCGYLLQAEGVFISLLLITTYPVVCVSVRQPVYSWQHQTHCFIAHQFEGCDKFLESMACPLAGGWPWKK